MTENYRRLMQLADEVFNVKNDPDQLDVNQDVIAKLRKIHPATVSEYDEGNGPVAWLLVIPTIDDLMNRFLENKITERELFELTPLDTEYDALYLCSALVLEEYRRKGITKNLSLDAIKGIQNDHPIQSLFIWPFSKEGFKTAEAIARLTSLVLYRKI